MDINFLSSRDDHEYFYSTYDHYNGFKKESNKKVYFGPKANKECRFCGSTEPEATFKKKAHIAPELTGNKIFFSNFECDDCNSLFSRYEDSFANFGGILNTLGQQKGKRGIPKYKHNFEGEELQVVSENDKIIFRSKARDLNQPKKVDSLKLNEKDKKITINSNIYPHTPQHVAKIFSKIAISLLRQEDLPQLKENTLWLLNNNPSEKLIDHPFHYCIRRIGQRKFTHPLAFLMKKREAAKDIPSPEFVLLYWYGIFQFQVFIPYNSNDEWLWNQKEILLPLENRMAEFKYINGQLHSRVDMVDLRSNLQTKTKKESFSAEFTPDSSNR